MIDFHSNEVTVGGGDGDTLVVRSGGLRPGAVRMAVGDRHADVTSEIAIRVDGAPQPQRFAVYPGQVMAFAGVFVRLEIKSNAGEGAPT